MIRNTSKTAYSSIYSSLPDKRRIVFGAIVELQECTDYQISQFLQWAINTVTPRRGELEKQGLIESKRIIFNLNNRPAHLWQLTDKAKEQLYNY